MDSLDSGESSTAAAVAAQFKALGIDPNIDGRGAASPSASKQETSSFHTASPFPLPCPRSGSLLQLDVSGRKNSSSSTIEVPLTFDHLCDICESLFDDEASEYILSNGTTPYAEKRTKQNLNALIRSAGEGCHLCNKLYRYFYFFRRNNLQSRSDFRDVKATVFEYSISLIGGEFRIYISSSLKGNGYIVISRISTRKIENLQANRVAPPHTLSASSIKQIKDWITHCIENHDHCQQNRDLSMNATRKKFLLPRRLLDIAYADGNPHLRVRDTSDLDPGTMYVTLSHCWGRNPVISLLDSNITEFQTSIPFENLPKTFRDAVEVTIGLGYQYLWIDSLCIIQKSSDDWHRESAFIGDIYSNAILNIAATASVDGNGGLFRRSKSLALNPCRINLKEKSKYETEFICDNVDSWASSVEEAPLARRAWVVQERMLSTRVVHFAEDQAYWECQSCRDSEFYPGLNYSIEDLDLLATRSADPVYIYDNWEWTINRYTQCRLTFESDKFIALAGLAQRACQRLGVEPADYLAGIWRAEMPMGLLWRTAPHSQRRKRILERAPSWSWACIDGEVLMPRSEYQDQQAGYVVDNGYKAYDARSVRRYSDRGTTLHCQFISADIRHLGDPFGTVIEGSIILKGPLCAIQTTGPKGGNSILELSRGILDCSDNFVSITTSSIRWDDGDACLEGMKTKVYFLLIEETCGWCVGLVLQPLRSIQGHYQRLGQIFARPSNLATLLRISRNPFLLGRDRYMATDLIRGFTIKIK